MTHDLKKFHDDLLLHGGKHGYRITRVDQDGFVRYFHAHERARVGKAVAHIQKDNPDALFTIDHVVLSKTSVFIQLQYTKTRVEHMYTGPLDDDTELAAIQTAYQELRCDTYHENLASAVSDAITRYEQLDVPSYVLIDTRRETVLLTPSIQNLIAASGKVRARSGIPVNEPIDDVKSYKLDVANDRLEPLPFPYVLPHAKVKNPAADH